MTARHSLITMDGRIDRAAVLFDAKRQYRIMQRLGWDWPECLRYSWVRARAMQERDATACAMAAMRLTIEGLPVDERL